MADQSDVEAALVNIAAAALYPNGTDQASVTGGMIRLYRGWPANAALEADLADGIAHVSVVAVPNGQALTDAFPAVWEYPNPVNVTLTASVAGADTTFGGAATTGQLAGLLIDDAAFVYRTQPGDTPDSVAANLATQVMQVRAASVAGSTVSVPATAHMIARVVADQPAILQTRRQRLAFRLACWCADPTARDALGSAIDTAFSAMPFIPLADGSVGRLLPWRSDVADDLSTLPLYRRDLLYSVEYATTLSQTQPSMIFGLFGVAGASAALRIS